MINDLYIQNITIAVSADNAKDAYSKLCIAIGPSNNNGIVEYETDTFDSEEDEMERSTEILMPR